MRCQICTSAKRSILPALSKNTIHSSFNNRSKLAEKPEQFIISNIYIYIIFKANNQIYDLTLLNIIQRYYLLAATPAIGKAWCMYVCISTKRRLRKKDSIYSVT